MTADMHSCSYQCERPACIRAQRDELAARAEQDAAEIGRLRGEVEFHRLDAGALRVQHDSCIERLEVQTKNALHLHAMMVDAEARAEQAIAPAEVKAPAPAMPNGVEGLQRWSLARGSDGARWSVYLDHDPNGEWVKFSHVQQLALAADLSRAADNRDAAGVCEKPCKGCGNPVFAWSGDSDARCLDCASTPAAVPAEEAVAVYEGNPCVECGEDTGTGHFPGCCLGTTPQPADGEAVKGVVCGYQPGMSKVYVRVEAGALPEWLEIGTPVTVSTTPPAAQVQGDPEALARRFHDAYERLAPAFGYETRQETRQFDPTTPNGRLMVAVCAELAAHPSACELGAVRVTDEMVRAAQQREFNAPKNEPMGATVRGMLEAALQHRGDSQEVERG